MAQLEIRELVKSYRKRRVVDGISLTVDTGEIVGLLGPNGAGKTTSFYSIAGFIRPDSGRILLDGDDITRLPIHARARRGISYLPQEASIFRKLSVRDNVRIILEQRKVPRREIDVMIEQLLTEMKLSHLGGNSGYGLSGGERRRVEIMRALATRPRFILLDEPFAGIDPLAVADLQGIIRELKYRGIGVLISDHNVRETLAVCDRAYIVNQGRILISGTGDEIVNNPEARRFYLGDNFHM